MTENNAKDASELVPWDISENRPLTDQEIELLGGHEKWEKR